MEAHCSVKDVDGHVYVVALAKFLKNSNKIQPPEWVDVVKLSTANELAPSDPDWFFVRCAAILRHLYLRPTGITGLSKAFGRGKRYGVSPRHHVNAYTGIIRRCLRDLESIGIVEKRTDGGREISRSGRRDMDSVAFQTKKALAAMK
nr:ribosomal protein S19e [Hymenolepis microstoma]